MIDKLPMPIELQQFAMSGYVSHGRGFIYLVCSSNEQKSCEYYSEEYCHNFNCVENGDNLRRLVKLYNPVVEFVLFIAFEPEGVRTYLYPRLVPFLKGA